MVSPTKRQLSLFTAICLVVANMVGSGVYTSLGFQLGSLQHLFSVLLLWVVGGIIAICGALVYAELSTEFPENGGEVNFLTKLYNPTTGFLAGWISTLAGFAAPVAIVCTAIGKYGITFIPLPSITLAIIVLVLITILHASTIHVSTRFHQFSTILNIAIMIFIIVSAWIHTPYQSIDISPSTDAWKEIAYSGNFPVNLYWVIYAYTGWNAATYIAGEIRNPGKNLPLALFIGTILVTILYMLLNYAFLLSAPVSNLRNQLEIGFITASYLFGSNAGKVMSVCICITLISTASAMTFAGPRVTAFMGTQSKAFTWLTKTNKHHIPTWAIYFQSAIVLILILLNKFQELVNLVGFLLSICTSLAVAGYFKLNKKKSLFIRLAAIIFLCINSWVIVYGLYLKPYTSIGGLIIIVLGYLFWRYTAIKSI
ncbi:MAG: amino acid permease [Sediminibacterium sp.]|nr:amino acid permease [Sediminibacterium sp.]